MSAPLQGKGAFLIGGGPRAPGPPSGFGFACEDESPCLPALVDQHWPWWPLLPLYPYGRRRTLVRELSPGQVWSFEQLQGIFYVAVPIRMTVLRLREGLLLYGPVAPTRELLAQLRQLEASYGPVCTIVLATSSGLEHKLPLPALARAFPKAQVWVSPGQWSFPVPLPLSWLGFPPGRTHTLIEDGLPHEDQLVWESLGPVDLGLGRFQEVSCLHKASGSLLVTDALVAIGAEPPELFEADPTPLLFHARDRGDEPLVDSVEQRRKGWQRLVLFASYFQPAPLEVLPLAQVWSQAFRPGFRNPTSYFGLYPFRWQRGWQEAFWALLTNGQPRLQLAPVLERLVFPRHRGVLLEWLRRLSRLQGIRQMVGAHYQAPMVCTGADFASLAAELEARPWAPSSGDWATLAAIDDRLLEWGLVPGAGPQ